MTVVLAAGALLFVFFIFAVDLGQPLHQGRPEPGARRLRPQARNHAEPDGTVRSTRLSHRQRRRHVRHARHRKGGHPFAGIADDRRADAGSLYQQGRAGEGGRRGANQGQGRRHFHRHRGRAILEQERGRHQKHRHANAGRPFARDSRHDDGGGNLPEPRCLRLEGPGSGRRRHGEHGPDHRQFHHPRHPRRAGLSGRAGQAAHRPGQARRHHRPGRGRPRRRDPLRAGQAGRAGGEVRGRHENRRGAARLPIQRRPISGRGEPAKGAGRPRL